MNVKNQASLLHFLNKDRRDKMDIYNINGEFVPADQAKLSIHDLAVLRGYGVFDFLRTYNKVPFHLGDHVTRLKKSASLLGLKIQTPLLEIEDRVLKTLAQNNHHESNIRIVVTGGVSDDNLMPAGNDQLLIMVSELNNLPKTYYIDGVSVITNNVDRFLPGAKTINYIPGILSLKEAKSRGAIESLYVDKGGNILEGTTSNFFAVFGDTLVTPPESRILPGITRQVILQLVKSFPQIEVRNIHKDEIRFMDEAFISASNKEIIPVVSIDCITIGNGKPGKTTQTIVDKFADYTINYSD